MTRSAACVLLALGACLPAPTVLVGKACDPTHECGPELVCVRGSCAVENGAGGGAGGSGGGGGSCAVEETSCSDGLDEDCDGKTDCADPGCALESCSTGNPAAVCCSVGAGCVDLTTDTRNCGGCGISCANGRACLPVMASSVRSGACGCVSDGHCPHQGPAGLSADQSCTAGSCACDTSDACGDNQKCSVEQGLGSPGFCFY